MNKSKSSISFLYFLERYEQEEEYDYAPSTLRGRKDLRLKMQAYLSLIGRVTISIEEVDAELCRGFVMWLPTSNNAASKNGQVRINQNSAYHHQAVLGGALNKAVREGLITNNPLRELDKREKIRPMVSERGYLTVRELQRMMRYRCPNDEVKRAFVLSCFTGLRLSDVRALSWANILNSPMGKSKYISLIMQKTGQRISIPLCAKALQCLVPRSDPDEPIFRLPTSSTISHDLQRWAQDSGINKHVTFHISRHTFATMLLSLGVDLYTASKLLGHKNISTTQIYAQIVDEKKFQAISLLDKCFRNKV